MARDEKQKPESAYRDAAKTVAARRDHAAAESHRAQKATPQAPERFKSIQDLEAEDPERWDGLS